MAKKSGPYIGVTGFMSRTEVNEALAMIPQRTKHRLMVGVLMSSKTLAGEQNKWPGRYPKKEAIADIFVDDPRVLNLIHYSTDSPETLFSQLVEVTKLVGPHLDGFQLNMAWPSISQLKDYAGVYPEKYLLLQIGNKAMVQTESIEKFKETIDAYLDVVNAFLIDLSGGKGEPLDAEKCTKYLHAICSYAAPGYGIAGGLGPDTLNLINPVIKKFPSLSIDAEGRLRTPLPSDVLSLPSMQRYLKSAFEILAH